MENVEFFNQKKIPDHIMIMTKSPGFGARLFGFKSWLCHLLAMLAWLSYLTSLCLYFIICKMRSSVISTSELLWELNELISLFTFVHWRWKWHPTPVFLPGESQGRQSLVGCRVCGVAQSQTRLKWLSSSNSRILKTVRSV